ncbi:heparinase II/III family protein [Microbacterium sp. ARD32]|uniref:heparinase II/III family protein n=1 Tax=Microbacterium sp. ARD32 TaxID=2962577 RepID=UPI0028814128|nr:heparinase II/III family protein [Microbacterium sp. ARD32]MDT0158223.1 heparinase II/III family protein [Microbacterium sp. ARD32]
MLIRRGALREIWSAHADAQGALPVPAASDRDFWDGVDPRIREAILREADRLRDEPWPQPQLSEWSAYARTGDRSAYERALFLRNRRTRLAVLAAALEPTEQRVLEAADGLWHKIEQATWCWPAHDDVVSRGLRVPDPARPFVDLGAGEDAALVAWAALLLRDGLEQHVPGLVARLGSEARARVLEPFLAREWHWEGTEEDVHNWAPWIHGNLLVAAVAFADAELRKRVLDRCVDGLDRYLAQLPADGAIDEGFAYWWQGAGRAFDALRLLDALTGGAIAARLVDGALAGLGELARFPQRMQVGPGWFASFADAEARADDGTPWHVLFRAATLCREPETAAFALRERGDRPLCGLDDGVHAGLGRMLAELADLRSGALDAARHPASAPGRDAAETRPDEPRPDVLLSSIGVGIRERAGLTVVVKGGHNGENHNHNDLGSIAVAVDGVPLLPDLGRAEYRSETFSDQRYELWNIRSDWHSAPLPRGAVQLPEEQWRARMDAVDEGWALDLTNAYPAGERWTRIVRVTDAGLVVRDESAALADPATRIAVLCTGVPERDGDDVLIAGRHGSRGLRLSFDPAEVEFETVVVDDRYLRRSWGDRVTRMLFAPQPASCWELRGVVR